MRLATTLLTKVFQISIAVAIILLICYLPTVDAAL